MANQIQDFSAGLDELGLEAPFAEDLQAEDRLEAGFNLNGFDESPFAENIQEESSTWSKAAGEDLGSEEEGVEPSLSEAEGFEPEDSEASWSEASWSESPSDEGYEGDELEAFEPFEASEALEGAPYDREEPQHEVSSMSEQQFADAGETFDSYEIPSESRERWDAENLAWLDVEAQATDGEGYEPSLSEAEEFEPELFEGNQVTESPYLQGAEALAGDVAALEHLIESEAGAGTGLADRLKGAAAFLLGPTIREESSGPAVAALQRALERFGADLAVDGSFGANTEHAVRTFQTRSGLTVDGVVGPRTKAAIAGTLRSAGKQHQAGASLQLCDEIVRIAEQEYRRWHPATGALRETDSAAVPILQQYYREALNRNVSAAELQDTVWQRQHPWSAVFISWVMRRAGAGSRFVYSAAHQTYIHAARLNRINSEITNPFCAYRASEVAPQVGDLICASRSNSGATYDNIANPQVRATHCDIVTTVRPGSLRVIGGNVRQCVDAKTVRTLADGRLALDGDQARFFAVVRCRGGVSAMGSQRELFVDETATGSPLYVPEVLEHQQGESNPNAPQRIRWIQESLNKILGLQLKADGIMGPQTRNAIQSFQKKKGLVADGIVGLKTETAIHAALRNLQGPPQPDPGYTTPALISPPAEKAIQRTVYGWGQYRRKVEELPPDQQAILKEVGDAIVVSYQLGGKPVRKVLVHGHADVDSPPNPTRERQMSVERAQILTEWLKNYVGRGIAAQITWDTRGFGATQLKAQPKTEANRRQNRRVEILTLSIPPILCRCPQGIMRLSTPSALRRYQQRRGLRPSGVMDNATVRALQLDGCNCGSPRAAEIKFSISQDMNDPLYYATRLVTEDIAEQLRDYFGIAADRNFYADGIGISLSKDTEKIRRAREKWSEVIAKITLAGNASRISEFRDWIINWMNSSHDVVIQTEKPFWMKKPFEVQPILQGLRTWGAGSILYLNPYTWWARNGNTRVWGRTFTESGYTASSTAARVTWGPMMLLLHEAEHDTQKYVNGNALPGKTGLDTDQELAVVKDIDSYAQAHPYLTRRLTSQAEFCRYTIMTPPFGSIAISRPTTGEPWIRWPHQHVFEVGQILPWPEGCQP